MNKFEKFIEQFLEIINYGYNTKIDKSISVKYGIVNNIERQKYYSIKWLSKIVSVILIAIPSLVILNITIREKKAEYSKIENFDIKEKAKQDVMLTYKIEDRELKKEYRINWPSANNQKVNLVEEALKNVDDKMLKGENSDLYNVKTDLTFKVKHLENKKLNYSFKSDSKYVDDNGKVIRPYKGEGDKKCKIYLTVWNDETKMVKEFSIIVKEDTLSKADYELLRAASKMEDLIGKDEYYKVEEDKIYPISNIDGIEIEWNTYKAPSNTKGLKKNITYAVLFSLCMYVIWSITKLNDECKKIKSEFETYFPKFLEKFIILLGVGFTPFSIINYIADNETLKSESKAKSNLFIEKLKETSNQLKLGLAFGKTLENFAQVTHSEIITKFVYDLIYNIKRGDKELASFLKVELEQSMQHLEKVRLEKAKECNIMMILPLVLNLLAVIIIVAYPAINSLNN